MFEAFTVIMLLIFALSVLQIATTLGGWRKLYRRESRRQLSLRIAQMRKDGIQVSMCSHCAGCGETPIFGKDCPECKGLGFTFVGDK